MTTLIQDLQKQDPGSALVELFELEIDTNTFVYFHPGNDSIYSNIQFRDRVTPTTIRTYSALPVQFDGLAISSDGPSSKPTVIFGNVLPIFKNALGGLTYEDLVGKRVYRRRTLQKYLYGEPNDSNPPIEYGVQSYIIDRKLEESVLSVSFELSSPFDLDNVTLPARQVIPNACVWSYQGAGLDKAEHLKKGACSWRQNSTIYVEGTGYQVMFDSRDRILAPSTVGTFTAWTSTSFAVDDLISVSESETFVNINGTTFSSSVTKKFRSNALGSHASPTLSDVNWTGIFDYTTWNSATTYYVCSSNKFYSNYVLYNNAVWRAKKTNTNVTPGFSSTWERVDLCGKRLTSCSARYGFNPLNQSGTKLVIPRVRQTSKELPYGGFPSSRVLEG